MYSGLVVRSNVQTLFRTLSGLHIFAIEVHVRNNIAHVDNNWALGVAPK